MDEQEYDYLAGSNKFSSFEEAENNSTISDNGYNDDSLDRIKDAYYNLLKMYGYLHKDVNDYKEIIPVDEGVSFYCNNAELGNGASHINALVNGGYIACQKNSRVIIMHVNEKPDQPNTVTTSEPEDMFNSSVKHIRTELESELAKAGSRWSDFKAVFGNDSSFNSISRKLARAYEFNLTSETTAEDYEAYRNAFSDICSTCDTYFAFKAKAKKEEEYNETDNRRINYIKHVRDFCSKKVTELSLIEDARKTINRYKDYIDNPVALSQKIVENEQAAAKSISDNEQLLNPTGYFHDKYVSDYAGMPEILNNTFMAACNKVEKSIYSGKSYISVADSDSAIKMMGSMIAAQIIKHEQGLKGAKIFTSAFTKMPDQSGEDFIKSTTKIITDLGTSAIKNTAARNGISFSPVVEHGALPFSRKDLLRIFENADIAVEAEALRKKAVQREEKLKNNMTTLDNDFDTKYSNKNIPELITSTFKSSYNDLLEELSKPVFDMETANLKAAYMLGSAFAADYIATEKNPDSNIIHKCGDNAAYYTAYNKLSKDDEAYKAYAATVKKDILNLGKSALELTGRFADANLDYSMKNPLYDKNNMIKLLEEVATRNIHFYAEQLTKNALSDKYIKAKTLSRDLEGHFAYSVYYQNNPTDESDTVNSWLNRFAVKGIVEPVKALENQALTENKSLDELTLDRNTAVSILAEAVFSSTLQLELFERTIEEPDEYQFITKLTDAYKKGGEKELVKAHDTFIRKMSADVSLLKELDIADNMENIKVGDFKKIIGDSSRIFKFTYKHYLDIQYKDPVQTSAQAKDVYSFDTPFEAFKIMGLTSSNDLMSACAGNAAAAKTGEALLKLFTSYQNGFFTLDGNGTGEKLNDGQKKVAADIIVSMTMMNLIKADMDNINKGGQPGFSALTKQLDYNLIRTAILKTDGIQKQLSDITNKQIWTFVTNEKERNRLALTVGSQVGANIRNMLDKKRTDANVQADGTANKKAPDKNAAAQKSN